MLYSGLFIRTFSPMFTSRTRSLVKVCVLILITVQNILFSASQTDVKGFIKQIFACWSHSPYLCTIVLSHCTAVSANCKPLASFAFSHTQKFSLKNELDLG